MKHFLRVWPLLFVAVMVVGCESWKRVDRTASLALAYDVDHDEVDGRTLIRLRGQTAAAWIDPAGGRVVAYRLQRRPRWVFGRVPEGQDPPMVEVASPQGVNVLAGAGWQTVADPPIDAMAEQTYWVVEANVRRLVLLADAVDGLRWRKAFSIDRDGSLRIEAELRNVSLREIETGAAATLETAGVLSEIDGSQAAAIEGVGFRRWRDDDGESGFAFEKRVLRPGGKIAWREVWRLTVEREARPEAAAPPGGGDGRD